MKLLEGVQYLNLRDSTFTSIRTKYLKEAEYLDIAFSSITKIDLSFCQKLKKIVCDCTQLVQKSEYAIFDLVGFPAC